MTPRTQLVVLAVAGAYGLPVGVLSRPSGRSEGTVLAARQTLCRLLREVLGYRFREVQAELAISYGSAHRWATAFEEPPQRATRQALAINLHLLLTARA